MYSIEWIHKNLLENDEPHAWNQWALSSNIVSAWLTMFEFKCILGRHSRKVNSFRIRHLPDLNLRVNQ